MDSGTQVLRLGLSLVKALALASLLSLVVAGGLQASGAPHDREDTGAVDEAYGRVAARAGVEQGCATRAAATGPPVASALIRTQRGEVRVVSFAKGWDVYNGHRPGDLVALCLDGTDPAAGRVLRVRQPSWSGPPHAK